MAVKRITGHSGTYVLLKQIGSGGMGAVWSANWIGHGNVVKPVVIKILHATDQTEQGRERFLTEARIGAQLNHAGIVGIFDVGQIDGEVFLVMEWVDGRDLRYVMKTVGQPLGFPISCYILGEMLKALAHAHDRTIGGAPAAIIHYDIKPENVMVSASGEIKLTDFGIARFAATADTLSRAIGTLRYMSPEQMFGRARVQTDIYSAGVVFYELLHDRRYLHDVPAERFQQAVLGGQIPELGGPDIPAWAVMLVRQMLAIKAEDRPLAVDALAVILENTPYYQVGGQRLAELYAKAIGAKRSGVTGMLDLQDFDKAQVLLSSARRFSPPPSEPLAEVQHAAPNEPTPAERPNDLGDQADPDSPKFLRRNRDRVTPAGSVGGAEWVTGRTSTKGPPMLDATPRPAMEPAMGEPDPITVEPTEVLPRLFDQPGPSVLEQQLEPDAPTGQSWKLPTGQPAPNTDITSGPLSVVPASGPHPRSVNVGIIAALGVLVLVLLGVVIGMAASTRSTDAEREPAVVGFDDTQPGTTTNEPGTEPTLQEKDADRASAALTQLAPTQPEPAQPDATQPAPTPTATPTDAPPTDATPTADTENASTGSTEEVEPADEPAKPKPKPSVKPPSTTVYFIISGGTPDAEISVAGRSLAYNGIAQTTLRSGKSHAIRWRSNKTAPWHAPGTLKVEVLKPGEYYEVHLTASNISVKTRQKGSEKK
jgi:serine/threonine protein kinase